MPPLITQAIKLIGLKLIDEYEKLKENLEDQEFNDSKKEKEDN